MGRLTHTHQGYNGEIDPHTRDIIGRLTHWGYNGEINTHTRDTMETLHTAFLKWWWILPLGFRQIYPCSRPLNPWKRFQHWWSMVSAMILVQGLHWVWCSGQCYKVWPLYLLLLITIDWQFTVRRRSGHLECLSSLLALVGVDVLSGWKVLSMFEFRDESDVRLCWEVSTPCRSNATVL